MSEDLPVAEVQEPAEVIQEEAQTGDTSSETVSDTEGTPEEKPKFSPTIDQKALISASQDNREVKRQLKAANERLAQFESSQAETRPETVELDEFASKEEVDAWKQTVQRQADFDANKKAEKVQLEQATYSQQVAAQNAQVEKEQTFIANSAKAGINGVDLQTAANLVDSYGLNPVIVQSILDDDEGGLVLVQLSTDPADIQALNSANVLTIGSIYAGIKEKAANLKPKQTQAPSPADILDGNGAPPTQGGPPGVTYE